MRTILLPGLKVIGLAIILSVCFMVASMVSGLGDLPAAPGSPSEAPSAAPPADAEQTPAAALGSLGLLLAASLLQAAVLAYLVLRSRWSGWKLIGALFLAFYGSMTVVAQLESIVYLPHQLPPGMIPRLFVMGAIVAGLFCPATVLVLGRTKRRPALEERNTRLVMPAGEWAWKLAAITASYLVLYYTFGYFVAWKSPAVQQYYGGTDAGSFFAQMADIWSKTPWMFPFQAFRALLWAAFVLPVVRMLQGRPWEVGLALAFFFSVWSSQLLLPNPYMPATVRMVHLVETASSNFIFGLLVGWLLSRSHSLNACSPCRQASAS